MTQLHRLSDEELLAWIVSSYKLLSHRRNQLRISGNTRLGRAFKECQCRSRMELYRLAGNQWQKGES